MKTYAANEFGQALDELGNLLPRSSNARLFNGNHVIEFDTEQEKEDYFATIPVIWNKEAYIQQVNEAHNALFRSLYQERNYLSIGEISLWVDDAEFGVEAKALRNWWNETCKEVANYLDDVTEESALTVEEFIQTLPTF